jgi:hypothetical protein
VGLTGLEGGDIETRPHNVSVDWYIRRVRKEAVGVNDFVPVGTVIASGASAPPNDNFLLCDGASIDRSAYPALFSAISTLYGGGNGPNSFSLPDYRGRFLRGAAAKSDGPSDVGVVQQDATGRPHKSFTGSVAYLPNSTVGSHGVTQHNRARVNGDKKIATCTGGGDGDTRPINVYVQFFIKAKE